MKVKLKRKKEKREDEKGKMEKDSRKERAIERTSY